MANVSVFTALLLPPHMYVRYVKLQFLLKRSLKLNFWHLRTYGDDVYGRRHKTMKWDLKKSSITDCLLILFYLKLYSSIFKSMVFIYSLGKKSKYNPQFWPFLYQFFNCFCYYCFNTIVLLLFCFSNSII